MLNFLIENLPQKVLFQFYRAFEKEFLFREAIEHKRHLLNHHHICLLRCVNNIRFGKGEVCVSPGWIQLNDAFKDVENDVVEEWLRELTEMGIGRIKEDDSGGLLYCFGGNCDKTKPTR